MTFFHFMHVILGLIILFAVMFKSERGGYSKRSITAWKPVPLTGIWLTCYGLCYFRWYIWCADMQMTRATYIWITLLGLTLFAYALATQGLSGQAFVLAVLISSLLKGQLIIDHFMMLKSAPLMWRIIISGLVTGGTGDHYGFVSCIWMNETGTDLRSVPNDTY